MTWKFHFPRAVVTTHARTDSKRVVNASALLRMHVRTYGRTTRKHNAAYAIE